MTTEFRDRFTRLDPAVWTTAYLPAWSSLAEASATYTTGRDGLALTIPEDHPLWCADLHPTPLRVSGIQSVNRSGPVGSTDAPQSFRDGLRVREEQSTVLGFAPCYGRIDVTCSARLTERSMFSAWMVGLEDQPDRCGEICIMEVFGNTVDGGRVSIEQGIHKFRDTALHEDFSAQPRDFDISAEHTYGVEWRPGSVDFTIDELTTRVADQAPDYPMMLILAVFDFPDQSGDTATVPQLRVSEVSGIDLGPGSLVRS